MLRVRPPLTWGKAPHHAKSGDCRPPSRGAGRQYPPRAEKLGVCSHPPPGACAHALTKRPVRPEMGLSSRRRHSSKASSQRLDPPSEAPRSRPPWRPPSCAACGASSPCQELSSPCQHPQGRSPSEMKHGQRWLPSHVTSGGSTCTGRTSAPMTRRTCSRRTSRARSSGRTWSACTKTSIRRPPTRPGPSCSLGVLRRSSTPSPCTPSSGRNTTTHRRTAASSTCGSSWRTGP